jgi:hypothetical protein
MSAKKSIFDQSGNSLSHLERSGHWYTRFHSAAMDEVLNLTDERAYTIWSFILRLMSSDKTDVHGVLVQDDKPMSIDMIVRLLQHWRQKVVVRELERLLSIRVLSVIDGFLMCVPMVRTEARRIEELKSEKLKEKDKVFQKFFKSFSKSMAQGASVESSPNGSRSTSTQNLNSKSITLSNKATRQRVQRVDSLLLSSTDNTHVSAPAGAGAAVLNETELTGTTDLQIDSAVCRF